MFIHTGNYEMLHMNRASHLCTVINKLLHHNTWFAV